MMLSIRVLWATALLVTCALALPARAERMNPSFVTMQSAALSEFWHKPIYMHAEVLMPDSYATSPEKKYPTIYAVHGFGGSYRLSANALRTWREAQAKAGAEFIIVSLDASFPTGHHEFADSANNGPWGRALTTELIPQLEANYRMIATPQDRFLTGHSSGGWSTLWLQINYPDLFGGTWSTSPDSPDFHDFTGPDLYRVPQQTMYKDPSGNEYGFVRRNGADTMTLRRYIEREDERGPGGQFDSFDAVFGPRGADGKPLRLFDLKTGVIDPTVAQYWEAHYDIVRLLHDRWPQLAPKLKGKLHVVMGSADTFHLEGGTYRLRDELKALGSDAQVTIVPGADHGTVFQYDGGLIAHIVREMKQALP
jgi:S-formylglutathione hydrolase FrmB